MDEASVRPVVEAHAEAVVDPIDVDHVTNDFVEDLRPQVPSLATVLPQPVTSADVEKVDVQDDHADVTITYSGAEQSVSINTRWEDRGSGRPQIVEAAPAE
jgi:hypothetical protein